jgi:hypothetical protein
LSLNHLRCNIPNTGTRGFLPSITQSVYLNPSSLVASTRTPIRSFLRRHVSCIVASSSSVKALAPHVLALVGVVGRSVSPVGRSYGRGGNQYVRLSDGFLVGGTPNHDTGPVAVSVSRSVSRKGMRLPPIVGSATDRALGWSHKIGGTARI